MTMGPVEIERKLRQLDNDVQSIYTMLSAIQGTQERHTNRLGEIAVKVDGLESQFGTLDRKIGTLDNKVDSLAAKVTDLDGNLGTLDDKLGTLGDKLGTLDGKLDTVLALLTRDTRD